MKTGVGNKVLFVATVDSHIELFHLPYLKMFKDKGYKVHVATESKKKIKYCDKKHQISIARSPFKLRNLIAIRQLKKIVEKEHFDIIHCHTPMGGVVTRLAARKSRKRGTRVIYTAHGFHFYKGAPLKNWLLFYPVEKHLARYTDTIITINDEDYKLAKQKFKKRCHDIEYVPGVGIDEKKFEKRLIKKQKQRIRKSLKLKDDDFVMIYAAELSRRKNQMWLIKTVAPVLNQKPNFHLILAGADSMNGKCQKLVKDLGLKKQIHVLGFREDIADLIRISDVALSSSKQEGLPSSLIESACAGLPIIATDCRGNRDVVKKSRGFLIPQGDVKDFQNTIADAENNADLAPREKLAESIRKKISISEVKKIMAINYFRTE